MLVRPLMTARRADRLSITIDIPMIGNGRLLIGCSIRYKDIPSPIAALIKSPRHSVEPDDKTAFILPVCLDTEVKTISLNVHVALPIVERLFSVFSAEVLPFPCCKFDHDTSLSDCDPPMLIGGSVLR